MSLASIYKYNTFQNLPEDRYEGEVLAGTCSDIWTGILTVLVVGLAVTGAISLCFPALLLTRDDGHSLPQIKINSFSVTGFNFSSNQVYGNWDFEFVAANFNDGDSMIFAFQHTSVSLLLKNHDVPAYMTNLQPFELGPESLKSHLVGKFSGSSEFLDDSVTKIVANEIMTDGVVKFDVKLEALVKTKLRVGVLVANCDDMGVLISMDTGMGKMVGGTVDCNVEFTANFN
ncbi:hypothetical protein DCAR_0520909 [Daucus carota subsp. sativus]|uniref:Late embryogenesis abundant protein LEA-2 subgroup domain-containing protein n=1 Tax=Daucus carota subsp. sativus TaxID=79200 RepID=A0A162A461_DAUCS|nr:PREDICTED: uncharacterized protein LOC108222637 [Daucus carota subsp. sativus]WOH01525.1 hypothetical protein DCAR_0520909 [Daucus carota subsp. sativus]